MGKKTRLDVEKNATIHFLYTVYLTVLIATQMNMLYMTRPFKKHTWDVFHTPPDVLRGLGMAYDIHEKH